MKLRLLSKKDIPGCKEIWTETFEDSPEFINWFFVRRFNPAYSVCCEDNGKIVSVIHGYPMPVKCFGKICNGVMMSGVATIPSYRNRGIMHSLMDFFKNTIAESGAEVIVYKAANPEIYYSYDQYPCTMKADFLYHNTYFSDKEITNKFNLKNALDIYNSFSENYQGIIVRDSDLMKLRSEDYFTDKCEFTMLENRAYCFGELVDETYILHEVCYKKPEDFFELLRGINVCKIKGILPADFPMADKFKNFTVGSHGTIVPISPDLIPAEPKELTIGKRTEKLLLRPSTFILDEY